MPIADIVKSGARNQVNTIASLLTTPVGPFATIDKIVRNSRSTARRIRQQTGVRAPDVMKRYRLLRR